MLTSKPLTRTKLIAAVAPKCLRCDKPINVRPRWIRNGWLHPPCEPPADCLDSKERRAELHKNYLASLESIS